MNTLAEYQDFWAEIRSQIMRMRDLSSFWNEDEYAIRDFTHPIEPIVPEKLISEFEIRNNVEIPLSYRSYLLYFGGAGPCDSGRTLDFTSHVYDSDVRTPSKLEIFENPVDIDCDIGEVHPIQSGNGTVAIASIASPVTPYLVLNGEASGYVYWWNHGDMVGAFGEFSEWYTRWANKSLAFVEKEYAVFTTPIGTSQEELWELFPGELKHEERDGIEFVHHRKIEAAFIFDSKGHVISVHNYYKFFRDLKSKV